MNEWIHFIIKHFSSRSFSSVKMGFRKQLCNLIAAHFKVNYNNIIRKITQSEEDETILDVCPLDWLESMLRHMDDIIALKQLEKYIDPFGHGLIPKTTMTVSSRYIPKSIQI